MLDVYAAAAVSRRRIVGLGLGLENGVLSGGG